MKSAVAGNRTQVAVLTAVSPLPPELDAPVNLNYVCLVVVTLNYVCSDILCAFYLIELSVVDSFVLVCARIILLWCFVMFFLE